MAASTDNKDNVMEAKAVARHVRVTPMKARRVVDLVRGKQAVEALAVLQFAPQAASDPVRKVLQSAIANARVVGPCPAIPGCVEPCRDKWY